MWDTKRKIIWLVLGLAMGTFVAYNNSIDDDGSFVFSFFVFMETLIVIIITVLFLMYSRKKSG